MDNTDSRAFKYTDLKQYSRYAHSSAILKTEHFLLRLSCYCLFLSNKVSENKYNMWFYWLLL